MPGARSATITGPQSYHVVWLDGVYSWQPGRSRVAWHEHEGLEDADVARLVRRVQDRVLRALRRAGKW